MPWPVRHPNIDPATGEPEVVVFDDGGSGLFEAARSRFTSYGCEVSCDARHTVWVKRTDGSLSIGLSPWMLGRRSIDQLLDSIEKRLAG